MFIRDAVNWIGQLYQVFQGLIVRAAPIAFMRLIHILAATGAGVDQIALIQRERETAATNGKGVHNNAALERAFPDFLYAKRRSIAAAIGTFDFLNGQHYSRGYSVTEY